MTPNLRVLKNPIFSVSKMNFSKSPLLAQALLYDD